MNEFVRFTYKIKYLKKLLFFIKKRFPLFEFQNNQDFNDHTFEGLINSIIYNVQCTLYITQIQQ